MDRRRESQLLALAVERGLVGEEEARAVERAPPPAAPPDSLEAAWGPRLAALIRDGRLDRDGVLGLLQEMDATAVEVPWGRRRGGTGGEPGRSAGGEENAEGGSAGAGIAGGVDWARNTGTPGDGEDQPGGAEPPSFFDGWDRYRVVSFLGAGGMGQVYKAFDPSLGRFAALKFLRWNDPLQLERFLREARAQARVEHENVCKVYEAGRAEDRPYIAMQLIDGPSLGEVADELTTEQKVGVIRDVARAIHAAHRTGLIHRDLKPGNILLERQEDGSWHPFVVDFGLAHDQEAMGLTRTGAVTGTPAYLSPEQARGGELDRRSDVYSLGVVLYEILSGDVPLRGGSLAESLIKVVSESPTPLRRLDPKVPRDLETIVMKCLEKEPQRRYESARALAEDLERFLDGAPILARPPRWSYRAGKWVRRNRALAGVLAGALLLLLAGAGWSLRAQWRAERRARLLQRFTQSVVQVESEMRLASLLPRHDTTPHKERLRRRMDGIEEEMARLGGVAAGPGHYALGRGYLALHEYERALEHLEEAWRLGERRPEVASGLGRALGVLYQKALLVLTGSLAPGGGSEAATVGQASQEQIERLYREPALVYLRQGGAADNPYVQAMIAFYDKRYGEARELALRAYREAPWSYEARQLEAEILIEQGEAAQSRGRYDDARRFYQAAGEVYAELLDVARSDASLYAAECGRRLQSLLLQAEWSFLADDEVAWALGPCDAALEVDPDLAEAYTRKAHVYWRWGQQLEKRGEDPRSRLREAARLASRALELNERELQAYHHLATANRELADWSLQHGEDPEPYLEVAIASLEKSLAIQPRVASNLNGLGNAYVIKARAETRRGADPVPALARAIRSYRQVIELEPQHIGALSNLGMVALDKAEHEMERGEDPTPSIQEAIGVLEQALELNPRMVPAHTNLGAAYLTLGEVQLLDGRDPRAALDEAIARFLHAASLKPGDADHAFNLGYARRCKAQHALARGGDPGPELEQARRAFADAVRLAADAQTYLEQARVEVVAVRWAVERGGSPAAAARASRQALARGRALNDRYPEIHQESATLEYLLARRALELGEPPGEHLSRGRAAAGRALELHPEMAEALALRGAFTLLEARQAGDGPGAAGPAARKLARRAAADLETALARNPRLGGEFGELLAHAEALAGTATEPLAAVR